MYQYYKMVANKVTDFSLFRYPNRRNFHSCYR